MDFEKLTALCFQTTFKSFRQAPSPYLVFPFLSVLTIHLSLNSMVYSFVNLKFWLHRKKFNNSNFSVVWPSGCCVKLFGVGEEGRSAENMEKTFSIRLHGEPNFILSKIDSYWECNAIWNAWKFLNFLRFVIWNAHLVISYSFKWILNNQETDWWGPSILFLYYSFNFWQCFLWNSSATVIGKQYFQVFVIIFIHLFNVTIFVQTDATCLFWKWVFHEFWATIMVIIPCAVVPDFWL